jgi:CII-binding regulator of phage lambda lysogenization HflD
MSTQDLIHSLNRSKAGVEEGLQHATKLLQLEGEVKRAEQTLAGLQAKIAQATPLAAQVEEFDQRIKAKRHELAQVELEVSRKSVEHGTIEGKLRDLRKQISGNLQHP